MLKRKWTPLSPQMRILELLNAAPMPLPLTNMRAHEFLGGLSAHAIAVNLKILANRGCVADNLVANGSRAFALTPAGKQQLDIDRIARARLAQRLKIEIPPDMYLTAAAPQIHTAKKGDDAAAAGPTPPQPKTPPIRATIDQPETPEAGTPLIYMAIISRRHLRVLAARALATPAPLTDDDRAALAAAIKEAA